ncbi:MAG: hypothetical protein ACM31C_11100 [Acidobacteriota bacterium]
MPSSTSSSDRPGLRLTASNRPGVAQPVPERDIPERPWRPIFVAAFGVFLLLLGAWETYWRAYGVVPSYRNDDGAWAIERRRIDEGEGGKTVLIGSSRMLFDIQLPVWERIAGERPIQLAIEGTSPVPILEDLADDPAFTGRVLVGVAPDIFFTGFAAQAKVVGYFHKESPAQRAGSWLSRRLVEPYLAYYDPDFALATVIRRQAWPQRMKTGTRVRKLRNCGADRNTQMWDKVASDPDYRAMARAIWAEDFDDVPPDMATAELRQKKFDEQIDKAVKAVGTLRARGVKVVFVRMPSAGDYYAHEQKYFPRAATWEPLLQKTGAPGLHFEDHAEMQGYYLPEWSHMSAPEAVRFTAAFTPLALRTLGLPAAAGY